MEWRRSGETAGGPQHLMGARATFLNLHEAQTFSYSVSLLNPSCTFLPCRLVSIASSEIPSGVVPSPLPSFCSLPCSWLAPSALLSSPIRKALRAHDQKQPFASSFPAFSPTRPFASLRPLRSAVLGFTDSTSPSRLLHSTLQRRDPPLPTPPPRLLATGD